MIFKYKRIMKIFIIGGAGYIGSHMVKIVHKAGHDVVTIDNLFTGHQDAFNDMVAVSIFALD